MDHLEHQEFVAGAARHYGATYLKDMGVDIGVIQAMLGHKRRTTTEIYLHVSDGNLKEAVDLLDREPEKSSGKSWVRKSGR